ncbi:MAG: SMP-30/gluconolactonase/LRE family protein [Bacteroidota bacterium]
MKLLRIIGLLLVLLVGYVVYIMSSSGFFRGIENSPKEMVLSTISLPGIEDIEVDYQEKFLILSSDDRAGRRDGQGQQGHLYKLDLTDSSSLPLLLTQDFTDPFYPHGISMIPLNDSVHRILVVNHIWGDEFSLAAKEHTIEVFDLWGDSLVHVKKIVDASMISPNDIVALDAARFYFTNDHGYTEGLGKLAEEYLGLAVSNVVYYDGSSFTEVADGIAYANGINYDGEKNLLYVASPRGFLVKVYEREEDGSLTFVENIDCETGVDNIEIDPDGQIWIGAHPSLLHFAAYAEGRNPIAPSEVITIDYTSKGNYKVNSLYIEDGSHMSAATIAIPVEGKIFVGNVMDQQMLVLKGK